jgi:hypothetical protein
VFKAYETGKLRSEQDFLSQTILALGQYYSDIPEKLIEILVKMLSNGLWFYKKAVLQMMILIYQDSNFEIENTVIEKEWSDNLINLLDSDLSAEASEVCQLIIQRGRENNLEAPPIEFLISTTNSKEPEILKQEGYGRTNLVLVASTMNMNTDNVVSDEDHELHEMEIFFKSQILQLK